MPYVRAPEEIVPGKPLFFATAMSLGGFATGLLVEHAGIEMDDAEKGVVTHMPKIPYVAPRSETPSVMPPGTQPPAQPQQ